MMDWLKKAPTAIVVTIIIVCGFLAMSVFGAYVILTLNGADTAEFRQWVNTLGQILVFPFLGVSTAAAVSAAKSSSKTEEQTNGTLTALQAEVAELRTERDRRDGRL